MNGFMWVVKSTIFVKQTFSNECLQNTAPKLLHQPIFQNFPSLSLSKCPYNSLSDQAQNWELIVLWLFSLNPTLAIIAKPAT